ncbi:MULTISPECIES: MarR family winged helix-turn-helix transcriptional regulator [Flavobacterium]|uniref:MarR family winged helix-turn-helix transcriptional regulator n=1 Tax=Flavobacterium TaxID=237 RepID=UPI001FCBDAA3|nr:MULTISPECIES: helix-turn-helix domain-containing protein [Flavobacterium]UOK43341.1 MarR family winged helix-turn-helix transcriptional regulator [Flavobacterium enshiense]
MNYTLLKDFINLLQDFESAASANNYEKDLTGFKNWIYAEMKSKEHLTEPNWEGKEKGRSPESVINTLIVHMNRYAKSYSRSAIYGSDFSSQEDFIYLINLKAFGEMTKMDLIKKNVHEKPAGMQIINRLIAQGWVNQTASEIDKRSKVLKISKKGLKALESQMGKIREATQIVTGDLTHNEKMDLIRLLSKLNDFHQPIYNKNIEPEHLLNEFLNDKKR